MIEMLMREEGKISIVKTHLGSRRRYRALDSHQKLEKKEKLEAEDASNNIQHLPGFGWT